MPEIVDAPTKQEQRTYYSPNGGLTICVNQGKRVLAGDGRMYLEGHKEARFMPQADNWGRLTTKDPEVIEFLDERMKRGDTDVFDVDAYVERTTPAHIRAKQAQEAAKRAISDQNRLLQKVVELEAQLKQQRPSK